MLDYTDKIICTPEQFLTIAKSCDHIAKNKHDITYKKISEYDGKEYRNYHVIVEDGGFFCSCGIIYNGNCKACFPIRTEYVVSSPYISTSEKNTLSKYCSCELCTAKWYNVVTLRQNPILFGCLKSPLPSGKNISNARKALMEKYNSEYSEYKYYSRYTAK